jgi:hypothetical protein
VLLLRRRVSGVCGPLARVGRLVIKHVILFCNYFLNIKLFRYVVVKLVLSLN